MFHASVAIPVVRSADRTEVEATAAGLEQHGYRAFLDKYYRDSPFLREDKPWYPGQIIRGAEVVPDSISHRTHTKGRKY